MTDMGDNTDGNSDLHWRMTEKHGVDIAELREGQGRLEVKLGGVSDKMTIGFDNIAQSIKGVRPEPINLPAIGGILLTVAIALGGLLAWMIGSMQRENDLRFDMVTAANEMMMDRFVSRMEILNERVSDAGARELQDAYAMGQRDMDRELLGKAVASDASRDHIDYNRTLDRLDDLEEKSAIARTSSRAAGDYMKEHTSQGGHINHPHAINPRPFDTDMRGKD